MKRLGLEPPTPYEEYLQGENARLRKAVLRYAAIANDLCSELSEQGENCSRCRHNKPGGCELDNLNEYTTCILEIDVEPEEPDVYW